MKSLSEGWSERDKNAKEKFLPLADVGCRIRCLLRYRKIVKLFKCVIKISGVLC